MRHLLIVDDEHHIVNYLLTLFEDQVDLDLDIYKAYSGAEALTILENTKIDLILLDIHMPELSGIDVALRVSIAWPKCHIIFLTAYDSFDYIYQTNKIKNSSYILKLETDDVIVAEVKRILQLIQEENDNFLTLSNVHKQNLLLSHLFNQGILNEILSGANISSLNYEVSSANSHFLFDLNRKVFLLYIGLSTKMPGKRARMTAAINSFLQMIEEQLSSLFSFAILELDPQALLLFLQPTPENQSAMTNSIHYIKALSDSLATTGSRLFHQSLYFVIYPESVEWNNIYKINVILEHYMANLFIDSSNENGFSTLYPEEINETSASLNKKDNEVLDSQYHDLNYFLSQNMQKEYLAMLQTMRQYCIQLKSMHHLSAIRCYSSISLLLLNYIDQYQLMEQLSAHISIYRLYHSHDFADWGSAFEYLSNMSISIFQLLQTHKANKNDLLIARIKEYIQRHLNENLNLSIISNVVNYNETYISRIFKSSTGIGISDYIKQTRISMAKTLLKSTNESIQSIATATGFDTSQYFSLVFKKVVGNSPSEYRLL